MFHEYDLVRLKSTILPNNLPIGAKGTVLIVHNYPNLPRSYVVEFVDKNGDTITVITLKEDDIEKA